jgi:hypothetical protein
MPIGALTALGISTGSGHAPGTLAALRSAARCHPEEMKCERRRHRERRAVGVPAREGENLVSVLVGEPGVGETQNAVTGPP